MSGDDDTNVLLLRARNGTIVETVPSEMLLMIHEHWYRFPPINPLWHNILGIVMILLGLVSMLGNSVVIYVFGSTKTLRSPSNMLVMNLALSDFLITAEIKLAKIALMTVSLWFLAWASYLIIAWTGLFTSRGHLTPLLTIWGTVFAKANSVYNPIVYGISHPKYREALGKKFKRLIRSEETTSAETSSVASSETSIATTSVMENRERRHLHKQQHSESASFESSSTV